MSAAAATAAAIALAHSAAHAERLETYWRLEPVNEAVPNAASIGEPFFEQRLLPVRLVRLSEPVTIGSRTLEAGTFLYLVFNAEGRTGYCTIKDRSGANQARTLFIPILDQRPCFVDTDGDGRFDRTFSVYDKWGGPPSVRGSINDARALGTTAGFEQVDIHQFPHDMRMLLQLEGSRTNPARTRIRVSFSEPIGGVWQDVHGLRTDEGVLFPVGNVMILLRSLADGQATFEFRTTSDSYISSNNRNTLFWNPLPSFLAGN